MRQHIIVIVVPESSCSYNIHSYLQNLLTEIWMWWPLFGFRHMFFFHADTTTQYTILHFSSLSGMASPCRT